MMSTADFAGIRAFVAVGHALSFARAAEALGVSTSALSQAVRSLEDRLGEVLFHRTTRSVSLTDVGKRLFERMDPLFREMTEGLETVRVTGLEVRGTVRLHSFRTAAKVHLAPMLRRFAEDFPSVTVEIVLDDAVIDPAAAGYDASIRLGEVVERDMVAVRIGGPLTQRVVAAPAYICEHGRPETPADLLAHRCIQWRWPGHTSTYDWEFAENGRWFTARTNGMLIVNEREFAVEAALHGAGITMASEPLVREHLVSGRLVAMLEPWCADYPGFYLCYPQRRTVSRSLRAFIDTLTTATASAR